MHEDRSVLLDQIVDLCDVCPPRDEDQPRKSRIIHQQNTA